MNPLTGLLLLNVHILDANGPRDAESILVSDGRIAAIGAPPEDTSALQVVDATGLTVTPGLVDAHVHLSMDPAGFWRGDSAEQIDAFRRQYLRSYVAWGVTSVLDTGILPDDARDFRRLSAEGPSPDIHFLGPLVSPQGGYVSVVLPEFPGSSTAADVAERFAEFDDIGPVGVKLTYESGMVSKVWPLYNDEVRAAIRQEADKRDLPLFVHAFGPSEHMDALQAFEPRGTVHSLEKPSKKAIRAHAEAGTFVVSTMSVMDSNLIEFEQERLDDPLTALTVPPAQLASARDPDVWLKYKHAVSDHVMPNSPKWVKKFAVKLLSKDKPIRKRLVNNQKATLALHQAGVPIVLGSDSGNWNIFAFELHGPTSVRELVLLHQAGLDPVEAITAATLNPARMLGLAQDQGTIEVGKKAHLRILDGDPLTDFGTVVHPRFVVMDGELRTPEEWAAP